MADRFTHRSEPVGSSQRILTSSHTGEQNQLGGEVFIIENLSFRDGPLGEAENLLKRNGGLGTSLSKNKAAVEIDCLECSFARPLGSIDTDASTKVLRGSAPVVGECLWTRVERTGVAGVEKSQQ